MLGPGSGPRRWPADHPRERRREPRTGRPAYPHGGHGRGPGRFLAARRGVGRVGVADETRSPTPMKITFLPHNAYAIGGTVRSTLNLAGALAARHEVEIVSVLRTAEQPLLGVHGDVRLVPLVDERPDSAAYDGGHELMAQPPRWFRPPRGPVPTARHRRRTGPSRTAVRRHRGPQGHRHVPGGHAADAVGRLRAGPLLLHRHQRPRRARVPTGVNPRLGVSTACRSPGCRWPSGRSPGPAR